MRYLFPSPCECAGVCVCARPYPECLKVTRFQKVPQVEYLSNRSFLLLRHCSQGNQTSCKDEPFLHCDHEQF